MGWPLSCWGYGPAPAFTFIGRKNGSLTAQPQLYNGVHGWYRARIEHLFGQLWHWGLVRNISHGGPGELHQSMRFFYIAFHAILHSEVGQSPLL